MSSMKRCSDPVWSVFDIFGMSQIYYACNTCPSPPLLQGRERQQAMPRASMLSFRMGLAAIVLTLAYLGLAILGRGGFVAFFSYPPLVALAVVLFALTVASLFTAGNLSSGQ